MKVAQLVTCSGPHDPRREFFHCTPVSSREAPPDAGV